ncbi:MAG: hypothetical protein JWN66_1189 [Sphingomonas bacterium]|uniref:hypothetical protein n=1 Tax=Sphingomonas bacterium TaxID=1895847 RepID=UPI00261488A5|nr:hypothetical protein [Sphingomonas bacterium]MDB5704073.1 hypothetical protein [Sphingomonas bacterium]
MKSFRRLLPLMLFLPIAAQAQDAPKALPDPATVSVPDVTPSGDPKVRQEGYKFYYFNNPDVSFAEAYQDLKACRGHLVIAGPVRGFVPWDEAHRGKTVEPTPMYGGVAIAIVAAIILPKMERGVRSNKMRRCMGTRGYARYAIPEKAWDVLNDGDEQQLLLMQARLAAAPKPQDEAVSEE